MRVEKRVLNDALRVLGKVVCQTSPVELYRSIRFVGDVDGVMAMATDGVETVSVILDAFTENEIDFCVPFKDLKELIRINRSEMLETVCEDLKVIYLKNDDEARSRIVRAAELGAINSSDILPVFNEFKNPAHEAFAEPTRWSLLNAFTQVNQKYTPLRADQSFSALNKCFGLDCNRPLLWS